MGPTVRSFRKKPIEIEAVQWSVMSVDGVWSDVHFHQDELSCTDNLIAWVRSGGGNIYAAAGGLVIDTLEGKMIASPGDWIIRGIEGEFYPCKPSIFETTYELVE